MANTPKELRKVVKTGVARVNAAAAGKNPSKVPGEKDYSKVSKGRGQKGAQYDSAMVKSMSKQISKIKTKQTKNTGPASGFMAKAKKK